MKVAVIIGHASDRRGADSLWLEPEFNYNTDVANYLKELSPCTYDIYFHGGYQRGYSAMIRSTAEVLNRKNYDLVIELHYNAAVNSNANGCSVLYFNGSVKGLRWAEKLSASVSRDMNVKNLGAFGLLPNNNGYLAVKLPKAPAVIMEPFFGSNKADTLKFDEEKEKRAYAYAIHKAIMGITA